LSHSALPVCGTLPWDVAAFVIGGIHQVIRVLLVDDHAVVRQGVERLLESGSDMVVVGQAADAEEAILLAGSVEADVCVLDLGIPGGGPDLVTELRAARPRLRILVFTMQRPEQTALRVLSLGASGFLGKSCPPGEIPIAVRAVAAGRRYLSEPVAAILADRIIGGGPNEPHERLSPRELDVFQRLARGQGPSEIAEALGVSVKSISTYRSRVLSKMGVERNADLTRYALEHELLD
jgi:DNA-binding NarL/FixJ family response regulator